MLTVPPSCADYFEVWRSRPSGTLRACSGLYKNRYTFTFKLSKRLYFILKLEKQLMDTLPENLYVFCTYLQLVETCPSAHSKNKGKSLLFLNVIPRE
jgi:hypothetical protein